MTRIRTDSHFNPTWDFFDTWERNNFFWLFQELSIDVLVLSVRNQYKDRPSSISRVRIQILLHSDRATFYFSFVIIGFRSVPILVMQGSLYNYFLTQCCKVVISAAALSPECLGSNLGLRSAVWNEANAEIPRQFNFSSFPVIHSTLCKIHDWKRIVT
jgi:hypothetical protein